MMFKDIHISLLLFLATWSVFAQNENTDNDSIFNTQSTYIRHYKNRIHAKIYYINTSNSLAINDRDSRIKLDLNANKESRIGGSILFRKLAISYSYAPKFLNANRNNDGAKLYTLNLRGYYKQHWMQTLKLYQEKGFYIKNANQSIYLPETESFKIGGSTSYILNPNFSYRALSSQNEKQLKSVGSFIPSITYFYTDFNLKHDETILNRTIEKHYKSFDLAFSPNYYYNYVPNEKLLISVGASAGIGLNYSITNSSNVTTLLTELSFKGTFSYDLTNLFVGAHFNYLFLNHSTSRSYYVTDTIPYLQVFVGYRFKAPQKVIETADEFNDKLNIKS
ncbi:DUF4421 family protein [Formosa algae]|uniref:DUF4421 domain-containing protein n=1 Tax=Formosa algae TaxID=225843 RepID=A0A9X0YHR4_9FLAO|nr:DUF4421 family protein [Formosa algae]MBP1838526.1 hypothetical protein [Formosa algae]MDQ0335026.1 hypothetical protein [Formosa algae]